MAKVERFRTRYFAPCAAYRPSAYHMKQCELCRLRDSAVDMLNHLKRLREILLSGETPSLLEREFLEKTITRAEKGE